jgi:hypothetical protein
MNADGGDAVPLTSTPVIEESPDWQPIPVTIGAAKQPRIACGDLSLQPGGVSSVVAVKTRCRRAVRIAEHWLAGASLGAAPKRILGYRCGSAHHSFDQLLVECDQRGPKKAVAFVYREPEGTPGS